MRYVCITMSYSLDFGFPGSDVAWGELAGKVKDKLVSSARTRPKNDMEVHVRSSARD